MKLSSNAQIALFVFGLIVLTLVAVGFYYLQRIVFVNTDKCKECGGLNESGRGMAKLAMFLVLTQVLLIIILSGALFSGTLAKWHLYLTVGVGFVFTVLYGVGLGFLTNLVLKFDKDKCPGCGGLNVHQRNTGITAVMLLWLLFVLFLYVGGKAVSNRLEGITLENITRQGAPGLAPQKSTDEDTGEEVYEDDETTPLIAPQQSYPASRLLPPPPLLSQQADYLGQGAAPQQPSPRARLLGQELAQTPLISPPLPPALQQQVDVTAGLRPPPPPRPPRPTQSQRPTFRYGGRRRR